MRVVGYRLILMDRRYPIVEFDALRFREFFGEEADALDVELLSGGACNSNYAVTTRKGDRYVCRIHNRGNPGVEKTITDAVRGLIPVPEYLWVGDGVSAISFVEGMHLTPTENLMREAGRIIGLMGEIVYPRSGQILEDGGVVPFDGWASFKAGVLGLLQTDAVGRYLSEEQIGELSRMLERHRDLLEEFDSCRNLVHGDFRPDNILVRDDTIVGVLDWEFAHSGCSHMDVGNLLRHVSSEWEGLLAEGLREAGFELPDNWRFRSLLIDLASHLEFLTSDRSEVFKQECVERVRRLMEVSRC